MAKAFKVNLQCDGVDELLRENASRTDKALMQLQKVAIALGLEVRVTFYEPGQKLLGSAVLDGTNVNMLKSASQKAISKFHEAVRGCRFKVVEE